MLPNELKEYLNIDEGLERIRGNTSLFKTLLGSFTSKDYYAQMNKEIAEGDYEAAARTAHAIKGMAGNLSMPALYQASIRLEEHLKAGCAPQDAVDHMNAVVQATLEAVSMAVEEL